MAHRPILIPEWVVWLLVGCLAGPAAIGLTITALHGLLILLTGGLHG
ncbi:hypothetical protein [Cereibacter sphaeroides]|nr:hypothetical protein [Cereibacter sphaeroides]